MLHHVGLTGAAADPKRWLFVLHGIFGAGRNWRSVGRRIVDSRPDWGCLLVDLRLHGQSLDVAPPHTLESCAGDLQPLIAERNAEELVLLGHSFGGKVALVAARNRPPRLRQVWVIDASPSKLERGGSARRMLDLVARLPGRFEDRGDAVERLRDGGLESSVAEWMATNLEEREDGWRWKFRAEDMESLLASFRDTDLWRVVDEPPTGTEIHFVRARSSDALGASDLRHVEAAARETGRVHLHELDGGHWLNADNPGALQDLIAGALP